MYERRERKLLQEAEDKECVPKCSLRNLMHLCTNVGLNSVSVKGAQRRAWMRARWGA